LFVCFFALEIIADVGQRHDSDDETAHRSAAGADVRAADVLERRSFETAPAEAEALLKDEASAHPTQKSTSMFRVSNATGTILFVFTNI